MDGRHYPSDLKDEQWQIIEPLLPPPSKVGSKRTVCRRRVFEAICYVNREGVSWRALPHDFPKWTTVYWLFWDWRNSGLWQKMNDALRGDVRRADDRKPSPSAAIIDSQSAKTTEMGGERGYDAGKKINGRKRHIVVDTLGLILAVVVHSAAIQDQDGAKRVLEKLRQGFGRLKVIWADSAPVGEDGAWARAANGASAGGSERVCAAAKTLDRGADLLVVGPQPASQQILRTHHRVERSHDLHHNDPTHVAPAMQVILRIHKQALRNCCATAPSRPRTRASRRCRGSRHG